MALEQGNGLQDWELAVTKKLIGEFRRRSRRLDRLDVDDLMQECLLHWLAVRRHAIADTAGPPIAYLARVVRNKLIDLARERETDKRRGDRHSVSLDDRIGDSEDAPTFADRVDAEQAHDAAGQGLPDPADLRIDLAGVMALLSPEQRRLCELLGAQGLSIKEAAERLGIPRATLYEEIRRIRTIFARHGLDDYLRP